MAETPDTPTPESCQKEGCRGTPITLGDGATWLLYPGGLLNEMDELRDGLDDSSRMTGRVGMDEIREVAYRMLMANYDIGGLPAVRLILGADQDALVVAVMEALFGPREPRRTFTSWAAASLLSNGVDPATIPTELLPQVMDLMVMTRRTVPLGEYVESAVAARKIAGFRAFAARQAAERAEKAAPEPAPAPEPEPEPEPTPEEPSP